MVILINTWDKLVLDDRTIFIPVLPVLLRAPNRWVTINIEIGTLISAYLSKSRPHLWMRTVMKKTL